MSRVASLFGWIGDRLKDLFYGDSNLHLELNRAFAGLAGFLMLAGMLWDIHKGQPIDLGPGGLGGGLAAVITASGLAISAKTWANAQLLKTKGNEQ
jgi:hypothetical protein